MKIRTNFRQKNFQISQMELEGGEAFAGGWEYGEQL